MTRQKLLRWAMHAVLMIILSLILIEGLLSLVDPWGARFFDDLAMLKRFSRPHPTRGYILLPGRYQFSHWSATESENGMRHVPANAQGNCHVVFVGDSMTWGYGVNDNETWVNLVTAALPQINAVNVALYGYNSANVRETIAEFPNAHIIVYLIIKDDHKEKAGLFQEPQLSMIGKYMHFLMLVRQEAGSAEEGTGRDKSQFLSDIRQMQRDNRVLLLGIDEPLGRYLTDGLPVQLIPMYKNRISVMDIHPNPKGHREMAEAILPILRDMVSQQCDS